MKQKFSSERSSRTRLKVANKDEFDRELNGIVERAVDSVTEKVGLVLRNRAAREEDESKRRP